MLSILSMTWFEARAMTCPPWRQAKAMLSKWLPTRVRPVISPF